MNRTQPAPTEWVPVVLMASACSIAIAVATVFIVDEIRYRRAQQRADQQMKELEQLTAKQTKELQRQYNEMMRQMSKVRV